MDTKINNIMPFIVRERERQSEREREGEREINKSKYITKMYRTYMLKTTEHS